MARNFQTPINLNGLELLNARLQNLATAPASPTVGTIYYDTALGYARVYSTGSTWVALTPATAGYTDEQAQDAVAAMIAAGTAAGITVTYNDAANTLSFAVPADGAAGTATLRTLGTAATQAAAGNDSRLSDARTPTAGSVVDSSVSASAAISADKIASGTTNKVYTATEQTKLSGIATGATANSTDATLLNRANHTGTESADVLTDGTTNKAFLATERTKLAGIATGANLYTDANATANPLNTFAAPTGAVAMNSKNITGLADPVNPQDAATKNYVDGYAQGLDFKNSVAVATTANLTLSGEQTIDGFTTSGSRVLVKNQTTAAQNGIYVSATGAWVRATDADATGELSAGTVVYVENGTTNGQQQWVLTTTGVITIGTTAQTWSQFSGASTLTAGNGLAATGNTFNVGAGTGISVSTDSVAIDTTVVSRHYATSIGDGTSTSYVVTHNLNTRDVTIAVYTNGGLYDEVVPDIQRTSVNTVTVAFATAPAASAYRVVVQG